MAHSAKPNRNGDSKTLPGGAAISSSDQGNQQRNLGQSIRLVESVAYMKFMVLAWILLFPSGLAAETKYRMTDETRDSTWAIGLTSLQHSLKSGDGVNLTGSATAVQLGYTHIGETWILTSSLDVISGPYLATPQQEEKLDYSGTGFTMTFASSAEMANVRTYSGNYGFALGVTYFDVVGRVVGDRVEANDPQSVTKTDSLVLRVTNFGLMPSIFFTWLVPDVRRVSNRPVDLVTRIEGYHLNIGFIVPMVANYTLEFDEIDEDNKDNRIKFRQKNDFFGYSIAISFSALLGV